MNRIIVSRGETESTFREDEHENVFLISLTFPFNLLNIIFDMRPSQHILSGEIILTNGLSTYHGISQSFIIDN